MGFSTLLQTRSLTPFKNNQGKKGWDHLKGTPNL